MSTKSLQFIRGIVAKYTSGDGFDKIFQKLHIVTAGEGKVHAELKLGNQHLNPSGWMHGAFSASLVDTMGSCALLTHPAKEPVHSVSVSLSMMFLKGAKTGDELSINATTLKCGSTIAYLEILINNKISGDLLVKGYLTKYFPNE